MTAPFPKWVYDIVMEALHCNAAGTQLDPKSVLSVVPDGMKFACQGVLDYYAFGNTMTPVPVDINEPSVTPAPPVPTTAPVMPLSAAPVAGE